jgi:hypothetical protein
VANRKSRQPLKAAKAASHAGYPNQRRLSDFAANTLLPLLLVPQRTSNESSPDLSATFAQAAQVNSAAVRSPKWFGSAALQNELNDAAEQAAGELCLLQAMLQSALVLQIPAHMRVHIKPLRLRV